MDQFTITAITLFFPGIIATMTCDKIITHKPDWGAFKYTIFSFTLGITCYFILQLWYFFHASRYGIFNLQFPINKLNVWNNISGKSDNIVFKEVFFAALISFPLALTVAYADGRKFLNRFANWIGVSLKYGDESLFYYYLYNENLHWVYVRDIENKVVYSGKIKNYSESGNHREIHLIDVEVYCNESSKLLYKVPSIYLSRPCEMITIEEGEY